MNYAVIVQAQAVMDAEDIHADLALRDPDYAIRWTDELDRVFASLAEFPNRFAEAPESRGSTFTVRQILAGSYRVLYAVRGNAVRILRIQHAARRPFKPGELN